MPLEDTIFLTKKTKDLLKKTYSNMFSDDCERRGAEWLYRSTPKTHDMKEMEVNVRNVLDSVSRSQIYQCLQNFKKLTASGLEAAPGGRTANGSHGHRTLPLEMV